MRLEELNDVLRASGLEPVVLGPEPDGYRTITRTTISELDYRGPDLVRQFADEDALCRHLLVEALGSAAPRAGAVLHDVPAPTPGGRGSGAVDVLWSRDVIGGPEARGLGLLLVRDAGPLAADPWTGATQLHLLDVVTGSARGTRLAPGRLSGCCITTAGVVVAGPERIDSDAGWSAPMGAMDHLVGEVSDGLVLQTFGASVRCLDAHDGSVRWTSERLDPTLLRRDGPSAMDELPPGRVFRSSTRPEVDPSTLEDLDGAVRWSRMGWVHPAGTADGAVLLAHGAGVGRVEMIEDDGETRWERPGWVLAVQPGLAWLAGDEVELVDLASGRVLGAAPRPEPGSGPIRAERGAGLHTDDDVLVLASDERVVAYRADL